MEKQPKPSPAANAMAKQIAISVFKNSLKGRKKLQIVILIVLYWVIVGAVINIKWLIDLIKYLF